MSLNPPLFLDPANLLSLNPRLFLDPAPLMFLNPALPLDHCVKGPDQDWDRNQGWDQKYNGTVTNKWDQL